MRSAERCWLLMMFIFSGVPIGRQRSSACLNESCISNDFLPYPSTTVFSTFNFNFNFDLFYTEHSHCQTSFIERYRYAPHSAKSDIKIGMIAVIPI